MSETWLKPRVPDSLVSLRGYYLVRSDREGRGGGGVGFYVRDGIHTEHMASSPNMYCAQPEYVMLSVTAGGCKPFLLAVVYRPPKVGHLSFFWADFERLHPSFSSAIIIGDFNIDLNCRSFDSDSLLDYSSSYHLFIIPFSDTHHTSSSSTRIDHCLISNRSLIKSFSQHSLSFLSMHDIIEVTLDFPILRLPPREISVRSYSSFNTEEFISTLRSFDWAAVCRSPFLDDRVDIVNRFLCTARDTHVPLRSFRARRPSAPWLDQSIRTLMRERDVARRHFRLHPSPASWSTFHLLRNQVSLQVGASRNAYLMGRLNSSLTSSQLWSELRSMGLSKPKSGVYELRILA
ncbi:hypothetical protein ALC57_01244 [Trachymyrmex cornetzi]|uniref:Endonuclease/exonuclease/phosphatase domain-containing protein n=1 Tax=Trachymyrmex cornetzi TaxID=471704 RepID=A0A151JQ41_9HYME|nr:hypothetical protein ALC57_01244 [Trachymyrmex cornetzi]